LEKSHAKTGKKYVPRGKEQDEGRKVSRLYQGREETTGGRSSGLCAIRRRPLEEKQEVSSTRGGKLKKGETDPGQIKAQPKNDGR